LASFFYIFSIKRIKIKRYNIYTGVVRLSALTVLIIVALFILFEIILFFLLNNKNKRKILAINIAMALILQVSYYHTIKDPAFLPVWLVFILPPYFIADLIIKLILFIFKSSSIFSFFSTNLSSKNKEDTIPLYSNKICIWTCPECGAHHDRDVNASKTLLKLVI